MTAEIKEHTVERVKTKSGDTMLILNHIISITTVITNEPMVQIPLPGFRRSNDVEMDLHMINGTIFTTKEMSEGKANLLKEKWLNCVNPNRILEGEADDGNDQET
jgi:hypothetical protein